MSENITIHRITGASADLLENVAEDVFDAEFDDQWLANYLGAAGHLMIIALCGGEVVGQVAAYVHNHPDQASDLYIDNLGVAASLQRHGIARRLVTEVIAWGKSLGCEQAWIVTEPDNDAALGLYEGLGASAEPIVMFSYKL